MSVNSKMTAIANAVRAFFKWDDTIMLGLDTMAGYLGYVNQYIDNAFQSIENKGVTVPDDATVFDLSSLINSIPTGEGSSIDTCSVQLSFQAGKLIYYNYVSVDASGTIVPNTMVYHDFQVAADYTLNDVAQHTFVVLVMNQTNRVLVSGSGEHVCMFESSTGLSIQMIEINGNCAIYNS